MQARANSFGRPGSRIRKFTMPLTNWRKRDSWRFRRGNRRPIAWSRPRKSKCGCRGYERRRAATVRVAALLEPLRAATRSPSIDVAYIVKGLPNVVARARALIGSARKDVVVLASDEAVFRRLEEDLARAARRRVRVRLALPEIPVAKDLAKAAEVRSIICACMLLVVDGQQVLTVSRTTDGDAYAITSTDPTLVQLGLDFWESPRCCVL